MTCSRKHLMQNDLECCGTTRANALRTAVGFTLFEVAISLLIVSFGAVSVLMLFPVGLKVIQMQRLKIYVSAIACQIIDSYGNSDPSQNFGSFEGPTSWDVASDRRVYAGDLETRIVNMRDGLWPLPTDIARRIDSDGDEIQHILDEGGSIYYPSPYMQTAFRPDGLTAPMPNNLQLILIGVSGYAQHNAASTFPLKNWPYYYPSPGPPMQVGHARTFKNGHPVINDRGQRSAPLSSLAMPINGKSMVFTQSRNCPSPRTIDDVGRNYCWAVMMDPGSTVLPNVLFGFIDYGYTILSHPIDLLVLTPALQRYISATVNYAQEAGLDSGSLTSLMAFQSTPDALQKLRLQVLSSTPDVATPGNFSTLINNGTYQSMAERNARRVLAIGYLTHAVKCLARWYKTTTLTTGISSISPPDASQITGATQFPLQLDAAATAANILPTTITLANLQALDENCKYITYYFTAQNPYNWAVPRPYEHAIMMDFPLLETDLFFPPVTGVLAGTPCGSLPQQAAAQWRYMAPQTITTMARKNPPSGFVADAPLGLSLDYPCQPNGFTFFSWPDTVRAQNSGGSSDTSPWFSEQGYTAPDSHYTLLKPFAASERCRQLVFWYADWQNYEDFETAPSAPLDAGRYPRTSPGFQQTHGDWPDMTTFDQFMTISWMSPTPFHTQRNPEFYALFVHDMSTVPSGTLLTRGSDYSHDLIDTAWANTDLPDLASPSTNFGTPSKLFNGQFGADRNGNYHLDRGSLRKSVRLRASTLDRFEYFDMRAQGQMR